MYISSLFKSNNQRTNLVKKNILGSLLLKGVSICISLLFVPLTLGYVSTEIYGIWITLVSIMQWLSFFDIGFTQGLKNRLTESLAINDFHRAKCLVSTTYAVLICLFTPIVIIGLSIIPSINWSDLLNVDIQYNEDISKSMRILFICFGIQMVTNVLVSVVSAYQQTALSSSFSVIGQAISLAAIYIVTKFCFPSLFILTCAVSTIPCVVMIIMSCIMYNLKYRKIMPSINHIKTQYVKELFGLGYRFFIIQVQFIVLYQTTNFLISNVSGPSEVTIYNISYKYLSVLMMTFGIFLTPLWPAFTDAYAKQDFQWMRQIYLKMRYVLLGCVVLLIGMVIISSKIYSLWIGDIVYVPFKMTMIIGLYVFVNMYNSLQVNIINGTGKLKIQTIVTLFGILLHIPASLLMGNYIGCYGVITSMITITCIYSVVFSIQVKKILSQKASGIWNK